MMRQVVRGRSRGPGPIDGPLPTGGGGGQPDWLWTIDRPKAQADPPDDDFDGPTLDPKWTVVQGTSGTVDLTSATAGGLYDLTSRPGWLLMRADSSAVVTMYQDYELPEDRSIVVKFAPCISAAGQSGIENNAIQAGLVLNNSTTAPLSGNYIYFFWDTSSDGWRMLYNNNAGNAKSTASGTGGRGNPVAQVLYLRVLRVGLTYYGYWSGDGTAWFPLSSFSYAQPLTKLWLVTLSSANMGTPRPVQAFDWVREGGNGVDPW